MNLLVLSDLHLSPSTPDRNELFLQFLEHAWKNQDQVLIVGDLFDLWLGWKDLTMEFQKPILQRMNDLFSSGLEMDYVEGNRDFGISRFEGVLFRRVAPYFLRREWAGKKIHAEHGDLINESDRPYRFWRRISKNKFSYFLLAHLPAFVMLRMALRMEQGMRKTNRKHKMYYPDQSTERFCASLFESGVDLIVVGHFHTEKSVPMYLENRNVLFYTLPGWEQGFRYLVIPSSGTPYFTDWGKQNGNSATA
jgi:UDP-2,3-diacylglucosamine hydrolase